jgi:lycopene beta-cyclase
LSDVLIAGGGLQAGLVALAVLARRPDATVTIVERAARLGGNHLWSFHAGDVPGAMSAVIAPLVAARWPGYDVAFPGLRRTLQHPYASITSARLDAVVRARLGLRRGCAVHAGAEVVAVDRGGVTLVGGQRLEGRLVIDARGPDARPAEAAGYQKFVGLEVSLATPPAPRPMLMDATVPQLDGFRFFYTLPLGGDRLLVEDTRFSDSPELDGPRLREDILDWLDERGLEVRTIHREERGVLPLPLGGEGPTVREDGPLVAGYQGGWFHPTTGYSLPLAARLAWAVAGLQPGDSPAAALAPLAEESAQQARFCRILNRLLFRAAPPAERWRVLERFYRLPEETVARFYNMTMTRGDRIRILCGRPPGGVSLRAALSALEVR